MPLSHYRPQTSKQAKKAYRKSGATVRLSASELAVIERRAVLQERADRIKERELRRKANIRRKEERNQRERDAKVRMGNPSPVKDGGIRVGPSQLFLGGFMGVGKRKRDEDTIDQKEAEGIEVGNENLLGMGSRGCQVSPRPWRNPLQIISANSSCLPKPWSGLTKLDSSSGKERGPLAENREPMTLLLSGTPAQATSTGSIVEQQPINGAVEDEVLQTEGEGLPESQTLSPGSPSLRTSTQTETLIPTVQQQPPIKTKEDKVSEEEESEPTECRTIPMGPPPLPKPLELRTTSTATQRKPQPIAPRYRPPDTVEESWDDFFVSNTQIGRELSPPPIEELPTVAPVTKPTTQPSIPPPLSQKDDTADLLDLICTQDLDFSGIFTQVVHAVVNEEASSLLDQLSTQDLDFSGEMTQAPPHVEEESSDFDEDLTEEDLEDIVLDFELESPIKSESITPGKQDVAQETLPNNRNSEHTDSDSDDLYPDSDDSCWSDPLGYRKKAENWDRFGDERWQMENNFGFKTILPEHVFDEFMDRPENSWMDVDYGSYKLTMKMKQCREAKLAAETEGFDLSTQDLRELES